MAAMSTQEKMLNVPLLLTVDSDPYFYEHLIDLEMETYQSCVVSVGAVCACAQIGLQLLLETIEVANNSGPITFPIA